ncbi:MAG: hypothetical protein L0220_21005 [Acidobacteria bacterium]|nr:hypothetical protein [Acidobacteriota bacterium]
MKLAKLFLFGSAVGMLGGIISPVLGSILMAAGWFMPDGDARKWLSMSGSILLFLTIPLIIIGASCLDWMEKGNSQHVTRIARDEDDDQ